MPEQTSHASPSATRQSAERIASIDVFRGLTVLTMIFVNDVSTVRDAPPWLRHAPAEADAMTLVDLVFPAFLFIVGLALPAAMAPRLAAGPAWRTWGHVLGRTAGLLILGIFLVNLPQANAQAMGMSEDVWALGVCLAAVAVWNRYPEARAAERWLAAVLRCLGIGVLGYLAVRYRGVVDGKVVAMRLQWYGILGLIGWAYLGCCIVYLSLRRQLGAVIGMLGLLTALNLADRAGGLEGAVLLKRYLAIGPMLGGHPSICVAGLVVGLLLSPGSPAATAGARLRWMLGLALGLLLAGLLLRPFHGISKEYATPAYCLISASLCCTLYALLYFIVDVRGLKSWARPLAPIGQNPLLGYLMPSIFYAAISLWRKDWLELRFPTGAAGLLRAALFTAVVLAATALLGKLRVRLRL